MKIKRNTIHVRGDDAVIVIVSKTHGRFEAVIDASDVDLVRWHSWCIFMFKGKPHAQASCGMLLPRCIMDPDDSERVWFRSKDTLDCRRRNLLVQHRGANRLPVEEARR